MKDLCVHEGIADTREHHALCPKVASNQVCGRLTTAPSRAECVNFLAGYCRHRKYANNHFFLHN